MLWIAAFPAVIGLILMLGSTASCADRMTHQLLGSTATMQRERSIWLVALGPPQL